MGHLRRFMLRLTALFRRRAAESDLSREIEAHLALLEDQYVERGLPRDEARLAARRAFGSVEHAKDLHRDARTFPMLAGWATDLRLGVRMLGKYPGLTVAGGLTMAIAIGLGAAWYDFSRELLRPALSLPGGDRFVQVRVENALTGSEERRVLHDYLAWRQELRGIAELAAFRTVDRNVRPGAAAWEQIRVAELTASAFTMAGVSPIVGRPLLDEDERPGAASVAIISYDLWQRWFGGRAEAIGQVIDVGSAAATVVGVMPDGFAFPVNHRVWVPLQIRPAGYQPLEGPAISVVGRLADAADRARAEAALAVVTAREAQASPATHGHLRPRVYPYGGVLAAGPYFGFALIHIPIVLILLVACVNVGTLVYARTAARETEIAMRFAVGASRPRIVAQLFFEALALVALPAVGGLAAADRLLTWAVPAFFSGDAAGTPFWIEPGLRLGTVLYAAALSVVAAAALSLLPALKATGSHAQARLAATGDRATLRFGRVWTATMVAQVALTVLALPPAFGITQEVLRDQQVRQAFPAENYLAVQVDVDRDASLEGTPTADERAGQVYEELMRRVAGEPGVLASAYARALPGLDLRPRRFEIQGVAGSRPAFGFIDGDVLAWTETIGPGYFETFDRRIIAGRDFHDGDRAGGPPTVVVNEAFARRMGGGTSPLGHRVRYINAEQAPASEWYEIVGIVQDIGMTPIGGGEAPYIFHTAAPGSLSPAMLAVRVSGDPEALAVRVRTIAAQLDPRLRIGEAGSFETWRRQADLPSLVGAGTLALVVALGVFLSASGIFALVSVTVARRTRELGIRAALGASAGSLLGSVLLRVLLVVGGGILAGNGLLMTLFSLDDRLELERIAFSVGVTSTVMVSAALLACIAPIRRVMRINPTDALKEV